MGRWTWNPEKLEARRERARQRRLMRITIVDNEAWLAMPCGQRAVVDREDAAILADYDWHGIKSRSGNFYVASTGLDRQGVLLHRLLLKAPIDKQVDHINGNALDNRRSNLRLASHAENARNRRLAKNNTSGYTGISWCALTNSWQVSISSKKLGRFKSLEEAIQVRQAAERRLFQEFRRDVSSEGG